MATVAETLEMAADKLEPEGAWIGGSDEGWFASDGKGARLEAWDPTATCWCLYGAFRAVADGELRHDAKNALRAHLGVNMLAWWNHQHGRTQAEVVSALRAAAAKAREVRS